MFSLNEIVPWGRSFDEYQRMFALTEADLRGRLLGCADGPASFNAEASALGLHVVSCDPIYGFTPEEIRERIRATADVVVEQTRQNAERFVWDRIRSPEQLRDVRIATMDRFLQDFAEGKRAGRYVDAALPELPFASQSFSLAVCSHFLFLYADHLTGEFHQASCLELCRVASEVRVFPLVALDGRPSPDVDRIVGDLADRGHTVTIETVDYEFQRGANEMMRVRSALSPQDDRE